MNKALDEVRAEETARAHKFLSVCAVLFRGGRCVAHIPVPPDECLGGNLIGIQPDSVTAKFNDKISTYRLARLAPGAEIWSRGTDVASPMQLTIGDQIYIRCMRTEANGPVLINVLAAVEQDDAISLEPHHIKAISVCIGKLVTRLPEKWAHFTAINADYYQKK